MITGNAIFTFVVVGEKEMKIQGVGMARVLDDELTKTIFFLILLSVLYENFRISVFAYYIFLPILLLHNFSTKT